MDKTRLFWAIERRSDNWLDGKASHLQTWWNLHPSVNCQVMLFNSRSSAREFNHKENGYIKHRPDLMNEPHGWKMPRVVRVEVTYKVVGVK
jgi:hypothetical protein